MYTYTSFFNSDLQNMLIRRYEVIKFTISVMQCYKNISSPVLAQLARQEK